MKNILTNSFYGLLLLAGTAKANLPLDYSLKTASEKQNILYTNSSNASYSASQIEKQKNPPPWEMVKLFSTTYLAESFTNSSDEFKHKKTKLIHTYGSVAKVSFNITHETKYTGLFKSGALGIIRLSLARLGSPYTPGLALKLLVDGDKSQNIFSMYSLDGQGENYNFFQNNFESKINAPESTVLQILGERFRLAMVELGSSHQDPTLQSATDLAAISSNGTGVMQPIAPYSIVFEPTATAQMSPQKGELRVRLGQAPYLPNLVLYKVFVRDSQGGPKEEIGEVRLTSKFVASEYVDTMLFFQHNID